MSVPFSNTHLRVPRGFGTILEGLAREVLRDQPEDIPKYAAEHFEALLKQREESGLDPAEWAAKLEDRFYNNHAFKHTSHETISKEKSYESQTEDESSHLEEASSFNQNTKPNEEADLTETTDDEERHVILQEESVKELPVANIDSHNLSGTDDKQDPTITTVNQADSAAYENDNSTFSNQISDSDLEASQSQSFSGTANIDVCALELGETETGGQTFHKDETDDGNEDFMDSQGEKTVEETARTPEEAAAIEERSDALAISEEGETSQLKETILQSSLSQLETTEDSHQEAEHQTENIKEEELIESEAYSGETNEIVAPAEDDLGDNSKTQEESLVEISFEDVPEAQQITESEETKQVVESSEELQGEKSEVQQHEESEVTAVITAENVSGTQDNDEPKVEGGEMEVRSETEEMDSQQEASDMAKENVDSHLNDSDHNEMEEGVKNISTTHQPTTEAEKVEDQNTQIIDDNEKISDGETHQREDSQTKTNADDPDYGEAKDTFGESKETINTEDSDADEQEMKDSDPENNLSQTAQSNVETVGLEEENKTLDSSECDLTEEKEEEPQPEDTLEEKVVTSQEPNSEVELVEEIKMESDVQEKREEGSINPDESADQTVTDDQEEQRSHGSEQDAVQPEEESNDKLARLICLDQQGSKHGERECRKKS
ncbi:protein starmaker-like [Sphaeramia orbicularis]|uniref:protein starmaker-like n=1 Tax=Sphaeramia orbicularis TaxID=375764 RepID=UPI00117E989D|nr:sperm surface protein Sp17 [Sphaeramia orbicularis]